MEPSFKTIADLFQVPIGETGIIADNPRKAHGETPEESDALGGQCLTDGEYEAAIRHFKEAIARPGSDRRHQSNPFGRRLRR